MTLTRTLAASTLLFAAVQAHAAGEPDGAATAAAAAAAREPELWGNTYECNDWMPETAEVWKELDRASGKLMCKRAKSPAAREAARAAFERERMAAETAEQRKRDDAARAEQRKRDDAARAEQQFRASLQAMNPGQMLARADELNSQGDARRAREVLRTMMSRFPDHPMSLIAARQLTGDAANTGGAGSGAGGAPAPARTDRMSDAECEARKQAVIATTIPANASVTAHQETAMFMTSTALEMIDRGCPGGTPAQRAAERQRYAQAYAAAEQACNQVQSGGRPCTVRNHFGPGTVPSAGSLSTPYPRIPVPRF